MSATKAFGLAGIIGWPVAHSRSPVVHNHWLAEHGLPGSYVLLPVLPERLPAALAGLVALGFRGCNVTTPHKQAVMSLIEHVDPMAVRIGAVNTIVVQDDGTLRGFNNDGNGFVQGLRDVKPDWRPDDGPIVVVGAGGAARAIVVALAAQGAREIRLVNRTFDKAQQLAADLGPPVAAVRWDEQSAGWVPLPLERRSPTLTVVRADHLSRMVVTRALWSEYERYQVDESGIRVFVRAEFVPDLELMFMQRGEGQTPAGGRAQGITGRPAGLYDWSLGFRRTHGIESGDGDFQDIQAGLARGQVLERQVGLDQPLHERRVQVVGGPANVFVGNARQHRNQQHARHQPPDQVERSQQAEKQHREQHQGQQEGSAAARMLQGKLADVLGGQLGARFEGIDGFVLRAVVCKDSFDLRHLPDRPDIAYQDQQARHPFQQVAPPGIPIQVAFCQPTHTCWCQEEDANHHQDGKSNSHNERTPLDFFILPGLKVGCLGQCSHAQSERIPQQDQSSQERDLCQLGLVNVSQGNVRYNEASIRFSVCHRASFSPSH
mgnify:CR=1 FL=1